MPAQSTQRRRKHKRQWRRRRRSLASNNHFHLYRARSKYSSRRATNIAIIISVRNNTRKKESGENVDRMICCFCKTVSLSFGYCSFFFPFSVRRVPLRHTHWRQIIRANRMNGGKCVATIRLLPKTVTKNVVPRGGRIAMALGRPPGEATLATVSITRSMHVKS